MMEKTSKDDEEGYKWALKQYIMKGDGDDEEWKKRRANPLTEMSQRARRTQTDLIHDVHIRIMASLVPDEIIYNIGDYSKRELEACLLFGDVSGFTDLCEKYNKSGKGGPSRLTQVLNAYIGAMVQEILSHSGDVLKFSGDAFIAMWKETDHLSLRDAVHEALDCALVIQKSYGTYQTDVDVIVRVKLAVACGHITFSLLGDEGNSHYLMIGQPVLDIKTAESKSIAGEIVVSARVSHHISANEYLIELFPDGIHAKVLGVGPNWRNIQRHYDTRTDFESYSILSANIEGSEEDVSFHTSIKKSVGKFDTESKISSKVNDQYALRPAINHAARQKIKDELRRFIIAPVMNGIDAEEPIEYLTEIRQVCILFINIKVNASITSFKGIEVANQVYIAVCGIVKNNYGCVNKISNFDKDLMLLVIFGLRGFKHELESQIALKCAIKCYQKLTNMEHILGVAAAITTGKCYCGAFGHALRREYTVIGLIVNKAARLMVAYPNKVTCDRETFLHSKLESRNFILQEYISLKGIINPGPIYEFKGIHKFQDQYRKVNPLPLLGREQEIDLFMTLFSRARTLSKSKSKDLFFNTLIFQGAFRQGKTRLLEEILFLTDQTVASQRYSFSAFDYDVPYRAIRTIFFSFFDIPLSANETLKQKQIKTYITNKPEIAEYLCFLNVIFDVNFPHSMEYKAMDRKKKYKTLQNVFKKFCKMVFDKFYLLVIDDSQYIDDESWLLLNLLVNLNLVFIVATMGTETISTIVMEILKNAKIKIVDLKEINKWFHVGLACQMLNVDGIPPELEKTIQLKSSGNPGWVESFLVSLMQSGGLKMREMSRENAYDNGIVVPPLYMIMRLSEDEIKLWVEIMEERRMSIKEDKMVTRWKMFIDSCRESFPNLGVAKVFSEMIKKTDRLLICTLNESFNLEDVDPELVIDVIILKTFDALTSYEQLLLKCSAILGDVFPRDMLLYIMSSSAIRTTALAVKKLFEIHVLSCAKGNFIEGGLNFRDRLINPNEDIVVKCDCKGILIDDSCKDLPKYASCGYLRFRSSEFRETTYNLLTDNQKREFHERAIRYLEKEARRCRACGNGYFVRQLGGGRLDNTLRPKKKEHSKSMQTDTSSILDNYGTAKLLQRSSFISFDSLSGTVRTKDLYKQRDVSLFSGGSAQPELHMSLDSHQLLSVISAEIGFKAIRRLKDNFNLIRTFSSTDYSQCTCLLVLNTMYSQMVEHCKGAGLAEKIMNVTVEYAYVCIENKNTPQAIKILEEALQLLEGPMKEQIELEWMVDLRKGKLFTLLGIARMQIHDDEAYTYFMGALKCYGMSFPQSTGTKKCLRTILKLKHKLKYILGYNMFARRVDDSVAEYNNNLSECLGCLCRYFVKKDRWDEAELAAIWSLTKAVVTETDFEKMCIAYGNTILVESTLGNHSFVIALEVYALRTCHKKKTYIELEEIKAVAFLYYAICRGRLIRAEIEKFLHIGHVVWRLASTSQMDALVFRILPLLAYIVLLRRQINECIQLLQEIQFLIDQDTDNSEKCWYYDLCIVVHLETGLTVEPFSACTKFLQEEGLEVSIRDPDAKRQLIVCIWLWEVRNENWEAAVVWQKIAWDFELKKVGENVANLITGLYLLEGLIIYLSHKMDKKNLKSVNRANKRITNLFDTLNRAEKTCNLIKPRLYHMKGYYRIVKNNDYKGALKLLKKGKQFSEKYMNEIELHFIKHSESAWLKKLSGEEMDFWKEHADEDNLVSVADADYLDKFSQFTLPIPIYV
ncbi:unnamed protein product [Psylliodes chrysocephalus]|uniref:Guanylate cyclase domain-containing protein n=1 Tax=Psylliodes chrysocephalus TaxID=3402493 RepID=A0A9P0CU58_9CUCU|nr:unnamed protein product [Psylliodes chrysocephala]